MKHPRSSGAHTLSAWLSGLTVYNVGKKWEAKAGHREMTQYAKMLATIKHDDPSLVPGIPERPES